MDPACEPLRAVSLPAYLSRALPPILHVEPGTVVTVETLTQHGGDYIEPFVTGDAGAESVFAWTRERKAMDLRGAGPMNATVFGRSAGEGFGVHLCTGPIYVRGAEPGEVLEVGILDIEPRPCANPSIPARPSPPTSRRGGAISTTTSSASRTGATLTNVRW